MSKPVAPTRPLDSISLRALEYCPDAIVVTMPDMELPGPTIVFVNKAFEHLTGYSRSEALGRNPRFLQGPATDRRVLDAMRRAVGLGEAFQGQIVNYRRDGSPYVIEWKLAPMRDSAGTVTHWVAVQREVIPAASDASAGVLAGVAAGAGAGAVAGATAAIPSLPERDIRQWLARHRANGSATDLEPGTRDRIPFAKDLLVLVEAVTES